MTMAPRPCAECDKPFAPSKKGQRYCTTACRGKSQWLRRLAAKAGQEAKRDRLAPALVRDWRPEMRERVRALLTQPWYAGPGEAGVVALIDKISKEESL